MVRKMICLCLIITINCICVSAVAQGLPRVPMSKIEAILEELEKTERNTMQYALLLDSCAHICEELGASDLAIMFSDVAYVQSGDVWDRTVLQERSSSKRNKNKELGDLVLGSKYLTEMALQRAGIAMRYGQYLRTLRDTFFDEIIFKVYAISTAFYELLGGSIHNMKRVNALTELADFHKEKKNWDDMEECYLDATILGEKSGVLSLQQEIVLFNELVGGLLEQNRIKDADEMLNVIDDKILTTSERAKVLNNRVNSLLMKNQYKEVSYLLQKTIDCYRQSLPSTATLISSSTPPCFVTGLMTTARLYENKHKYEEVLYLYREIEELLVRSLNNDLPYILYHDRQFLWRILNPYFKEMKRIALAHIHINGMKEFLYENHLLRKKIFQILSDQMPSDIHIANDVYAMNIIHEVEKRLDKGTTVNTQQGSDFMAKIKNDMWMVCQQRMLMVHLQERNKKKTVSRTTCGDIITALGENEAIIDFIEIEPSPGEQQKYMAFLLSKNMETPKLLAVCTEESLRNMLNEENKETLRNTLWLPFQDSLKETKRLYISPTGLLHTVPFAYLHEKGNYLCDKYDISYLLSSEHILGVNQQNQGNVPEKSKKRTIHLFGGADFGLPMHNETLTRGQGFGYLPNSKQEVEEIAKVLTDKWEVHKYIGKEMTEKNLKALSWKPGNSVIHISSHGFYLPYNPEKRAMAINENGESGFYDPLKRTGVAFSGANYVWREPTPIDMATDCLMTATEIGSLGLSDTELVVLSACNTGLGDIRDGEGVFGIQQALRLAGVKSIIVSLEEVPDKETTELMIEFYTLWQSGLNKRDAFVQAQRILKNKYPNEPDKWAWFVLIE